MREQGSREGQDTTSEEETKRRRKPKGGIKRSEDKTHNNRGEKRKNDRNCKTINSLGEMPSQFRHAWRSKEIESSLHWIKWTVIKRL